MTASTAPALKINLSAWLHHIFSRMFPLCLISIHISAGDSDLRINNNMSSQDILFLILYNLILSVEAAHNTIQEQRHAVVENVTTGYAPMFPRTFLEESHRNPAAGRERGFLGSSTTESSTKDFLVGTPVSTAEGSGCPIPKGSPADQDWDWGKVRVPLGWGAQFTGCQNIQLWR